VEDVPRPEPGPGQVLVAVEAAGLCHTDIHAARGEWPVKPKLPLIPGHEGVGVVEEVGPTEVAGIAVGDRVALPWLGYACGQCRYCNDGRATLCARQQRTGYSIDGSYADYVLGYARNVVTVPDEVDPFDAAPLTCAGVTTYKAVKVSGARPASLLAVVGVRGLGQLGVQYARIAGAEVVAVDVSEDRLNTAASLGPDHLVHAGEQDVVGEIQKLGGADAVILTAASPKPIAQAYAALASGGTLVFVGLPHENKTPIPIFETVLNGITLRGSIVGTHQDLTEVFQLHRLGRTTVLHERRPLERVNEAFTAVLEGTSAAPQLVFALGHPGAGDLAPAVAHPGRPASLREERVRGAHRGRRSVGDAAPRRRPAARPEPRPRRAR
jgi:alcohol dehydrogenase, propanol-preferring